LNNGLLTLSVHNPMIRELQFLEQNKRKSFTIQKLMYEIAINH